MPEKPRKTQEICQTIVVIRRLNVPFMHRTLPRRLCKETFVGFNVQMLVKKEMCHEQINQLKPYLR